MSTEAAASVNILNDTQHDFVFFNGISTAYLIMVGNKIVRMMTRRHISMPSGSSG